MILRLLGYCLCICTFTFELGSKPLIAQDWKVSTGKQLVLDYPRNAKQGQEGNRVHSTVIVGDWVIAVIEHATVGPPILVPFVWGVPTDNERFAYLVAHNRVSGKWRTLQFPSDYFVGTSELRVFSIQSEQIRLGVSFLRDDKHLFQVAVWELSNNELVVSNPEMDDPANSIASFFDQPRKEGAIRSSGVISRGWGLIKSGRWDADQVPSEKDYLGYCRFTKQYMLFHHAKDGDFHLNRFDGIEQYPGEPVGSRSQIEQAFGSRIAQVFLAGCDTGCRNPLAIVRFESGQVTGHVLDGTAKIAFNSSASGLSFSEVLDVCTSDSEQFVAILGLTPRNIGDEAEGVQKLAVLKVDRTDTGTSVSSVWTYDLDVQGCSFAGVGSSGALYFSSGRSLYVWTGLAKSTSVSIEDALEIKMVDADPLPEN